MAPKRTSKPTPTPDVLKAVADLVEPPVTTKPADGSLSTANFEEGFVKPCSVCTRLWVAGVAFVPEQHPELCRECEKYPTAIMPANAAEAMMGLLVEEQNEQANEVVAEALAELASANAFFARNGNLRVHGNFTIDEMYEAFKARLEYEVGE